VQLVVTENWITKSSVRDAFFLSDGAKVRMSYMLNKIKTMCTTSIDREPRFVLPNNWPELDFLVETDQVPSQPATLFGIKETGCADEQRKRRIKHLKDLMFYSILDKNEVGNFENIGTVRNCVTVALKEYAVTAAHCIPIGVPERFQFDIFSQDNQPHRVELKHIDREIDFAVLKSVGGGFGVFAEKLAFPEMGSEYIVLGYNGCDYQDSQSLSVFFGKIKNNRHDPYIKFECVSPAMPSGCCGAGAFTRSGLIGIVVGGRVPPKNNRSNSGSLADHTNEASTEFSEYSHIVLSVTIFNVFKGIREKDL